MGASFVLSAVLGIVAARSGSKWWLIIPLMVALILVAGLV